MIFVFASRLLLLFGMLWKGTAHRQCLGARLFDFTPRGLRFGFALLLLGFPGAVGASQQTSVQDSGTIVMGMPWEPRTFDPYHGLDSASFYAQSLVYSSLVKYNDRMQIVPQLAERFSISSDGLTYRFVIPQGLRFSDGTPISVDDVVKSIESARSKRSPFRSNFEAVSTCTAEGNDVVLRLRTANLSLLSRLTDVKILKAEILDAAFNVKLAGKRNAFPRQPVASGPYTLKRWDPGFQLTFELNRYYRGAAAKTPVLLWRIIPDSDLLGAALARGDVDLARLDGRTVSTLLGKREGVVVDQFKGSRTTFLGFNTQKAPFDNMKVRQALCMMVNRRLIVDILYGGYAMIPNSDFPEGGPVESKAATNWRYDPLAGERMLREVGFEKRGNGWYQQGVQEASKKLFVRILTLKDFVAVAQAVAADFEDHSIDCEVELVEYSTLKDQFLKKGEFQAVVFSRSMGPDPDSRLFWSSGGALNYSRYKNSVMDKLLADAYSATMDSERTRLYEQAQDILSFEVPWIFIAQPRLVVAHSARLRNVGKAAKAGGFIPWDNPLFNATEWVKE